MRLFLRILLALLFLTAGVIHLRSPDLFMPIMPPWIPFHRACILISGVAEILGGLGLLTPWSSMQKLTAWALVVLLVVVFPANIYMAVEHIQVHGIPAHPWMAWARLALQPILIWAVLWATSRPVGPAYAERRY